MEDEKEGGVMTAIVILVCMLIALAIGWSMGREPTIGTLAVESTQVDTSVQAGLETALYLFD